MAETQGCARVTSTVTSDARDDQQPSKEVLEKKEIKMTARVGQKAPDFKAAAYYKGDFTEVKLSDFENKWRLLCFYPGDFTFV